MRLVMIVFIALFTVSGCAAKRQPPQAEAPRQGPGAPRLVERVRFPTAGHRVLTSDAQVLESNALWVLSNPGSVVVLEGHCDERGSYDYNMELGDRRARWVMGELMRRGVRPERLIVISKGESEPLEARSDAEAWRANRRVEFITR